MIKIVAFDLVGVLVTEKDIDLSQKEDKLERMFGDNVSDARYLKEGRKIIAEDSCLIRVTEELMDKIYQVKEENLFEKIKAKYDHIKIIIATNHVSFVRNFIVKTFGNDYLDDIIISAEIKKIKPHADFYEYILNKYAIFGEELLFLDDNLNNIEGAKKQNIHTIKVEKDTNLYQEIISVISSCDT